jgi:hypothetical protein
MFPIESGVQRPTAVRFPTLEGAGNHDGGNSTDAATGLLRRTLIERNRQRVARPDAPPKYRLSPNGLHYSWEWEGVHFVMLGVYPGTDGDCASGKALPGTGCDPAHPPYGWHCPEFSLSFLEADLKTVDKGTPLVLFMHYGLTGFGAPGVPPWSGYSPDFWWSAREAAAFASKMGTANTRGAGSWQDSFGLFGRRTREQAGPAGEDTLRLGKLERAALSVLDLDARTSKAGVKARYHEMLKRFHPDLNQGDRGAEAKLQSVIKAYKTLKKAGLA